MTPAVARGPRTESPAAPSPAAQQWRPGMWRPSAPRGAKPASPTPKKMSPDKAPPPSPERAAVEPQAERAAKSATKGWSWRRKGSPANRKESLDWSSTIKFRADGAATKATNAAKNQQPPNTTPPEAERSTGGSFWARNGAAIRRYTAEKRQKAALLKIR